jgi:GST-like protein
MCFVSAAIYALFWVRDDPKRVGDDVETVRRRTAARIAECWRIMDSQVDPGRYLLGEDLTALDLYVAGVSRWAEGRQRFYEIAPKMTPVVRRVDADPRLEALWLRRFPSNPAY